MERIPGIPGLPEPWFRTSGDAWVTLDMLVDAAVHALDGSVSPLVCKSIIQLARWQLRSRDSVDVGALAAGVCHALRAEQIVVTPPVVQGVLMAYARAYHELDCVEIVEDR